MGRRGACGACAPLNLRQTINMRASAQVSGGVPKKKKQQQQGVGAPFKKPRMNGYQAQQRHIGAPTSTGPEWKNIDTSATITSTGGPPAVFSAVTPLNLIAQGAGLQQHVGRKVALRKLVMRYNTTSSATIGGVRVLIVYDNNPNGVLPAITDILAANSAIGLQNLDQSDRFLILADFFPFEDRGLDNTSAIVLGKKVLKFNPPLMMLFNNTTTATITAIQSGAIYLAVCNAGNATGSGFTFYSRIRYTDN